MEPIKKGDILENLVITDTGAEGNAMARMENFVVFAEGGVPGDVVDVRIFRKKKNYAEGRVVKINTPSELRESPFCEYFGTCGGCRWQHMSYAAQLKFKQKHVEDALQRISKVELPQATPILGSEKIRYYRNKLEFSFSDRRWLTEEDLASGKSGNEPALGFHVPGRFDKILDITECFLQDDLSNLIRNEIRSFALANSYSFFNPYDQNGLLRNVIIRSTSTGEWMVVLVFKENDEEKIVKMLKHLITKFPQLTSVQYVVNGKRNDSISDQEVLLFHGRDYIEERMENLVFRISAKSFYQTNSLQAYELYKITRTYASLSGDENVYDLYTGTGTIASFVASSAKHVVGVDYIEDAIEDARKNAKLNNINNASFLSGDLKDTLNDSFISIYGKPDVIITDPPRSGMHEDVVKTILKADPKRIVYVSCNPSSQARDIQILDPNYSVEAYRPVDMFPHTTHVENVMLLKRRK